MQLSKAELCNAFEVSTTTVLQWVRRGCPQVAAGSSGVQAVFDLEEVCYWAFMYHRWPRYGDPEEGVKVARQRAKKIVTARRHHKEAAP